MTICLIIALAAVIAPLLTLLGLRHGTINTLRDRLVEDPVYREIRPAQTYEFDKKWFVEAANWPGVGFVTPTVLPLSSVLQVLQPKTGRLDIYDLIPTAPEDPLLLENGSLIPYDGECVLTVEAARRLQIKAGDWLDVRVTRSRGGRSEVAETRLKVVGVLEPRAGLLPRIYAPLAFVSDVEAYKEGYGAPHRGWSGDTPVPYLSYDGSVLLLSEALNPIDRSGLIINTGFARIEKLPPEDVFQRVGFYPPKNWYAYDLLIPGGGVTLSSLKALEQKLRGKERVLLPYAQDIFLYTSTGKKIAPIGLSLDDIQAAWLGLEPIPWGSFTGFAENGERLTQMLINKEYTNPRLLNVSNNGVLPLNFSLQHAGETTLDRIVVPVELMGVLRTAKQRAVVYDEQLKAFLMARGGFRGFRIYAHSIDHVPDIYRKLQTMGIETIAQVETIERIRVLDTGLARLFLIIAVLCVSGGTAVLLSSLYAAVERLRRDLGVLRLVGLARRHVFFFPMIQGVIIATFGLFAGLGGYLLLAGIINHTFAGELAYGEKFCSLPGRYVFGAIVITLFLSLTSSIVAALRTTSIDPAEAIRDN
jgi:putative ABC transport system permease protein